MDRVKRESIDWKHFDWSKVEGEIDLQEISDAYDELESLPGDMFVEYVRHLHDDEPKLYHIMLELYEADKKGDTEELKRWKRLWDSYGQGRNVGV